MAQCRREVVAPAALSLILLTSMSPASAQQAPARDATLTPTSGTASIAGVVLNDEERPQPVRRAIVRLTGDGLRPSRGAVTDDEGKFAIGNLPAGRFTLIVSRASYVTSAYGAKRPGRPGTPIGVANGETVTGLSVRLWRGAVVTGVVRDEHGAVVPGTPVRAIPAKTAGSGSLASLTNNGVRTNESGEYRIFGLEPGAYIVSAEVASGTSKMIALREAEVDAVIEALKRRATTPAAPAPDMPSSTPFDFAPVYYPAAVSSSQATPLTLSAGQEVGGIDITVQRVTRSVITGRVVRPDGTPASGALLQLTAEAPASSFGGVGMPSLFGTAGANGEFRIAQVAPGQYQLLARAPAGPQDSPTAGFVTPGPQGPQLWASRALTMAGVDAEGVALNVEPGFTIKGQLVFQSDTLKPPANPVLRVNIIPASVASQKPGTPVEALTFVPGVSVAPDGRFEIQNLGPGIHRLIVSGASVTGDQWFVQSAVMGGRDVLEGDFEIRGSGSDVMTLTLTDKVTELAGVLQTQSGAPGSDVFVIAYSANREHLGAGTRRVQAVRPGVDGRYIIRGLPAGDYLLAAVLDIDQDDWNAPGFLDQLVPMSIRITLGAGEKKTQDLRIGR